MLFVTKTYRVPLRVRDQQTRLILDDITTFYVALALTIPLVLVSLVAVYALVSPPYDESVLGILILLFLAGLFGFLAYVTVHAAAVARSTLTIDLGDLTIQTQGPRWPPPPPEARATALSIHTAERLGDTDGTSRQTYKLILHANQAEYTIAQTAGLKPLREKAARLAEQLNLPITDNTPAK